MPQLLTSVIVFVQDPPLDAEEPPEELAPTPDEPLVDPLEPPEEAPEEALANASELLFEELDELAPEPPDDAPPSPEPSTVASSPPPSASITSEKPHRFAHAERPRQNASVIGKAARRLLLLIRSRTPGSGRTPWPDTRAGRPIRARRSDVRVSMASGAQQHAPCRSVAGAASR
jgi:hypothetical protein